MYRLITFRILLLFICSCDSSGDSANPSEMAECHPYEKRCYGEFVQNCNLLGEWEDIPCPAGYSCFLVNNEPSCEDRNQGGSIPMVDMRVGGNQGGSIPMVDMRVGGNQGGSISMVDMRVGGNQGGSISMVDMSVVEMDLDGDGFTVLEGDCDDSNANVYPNAAEIFGDQIDQDCDQLADVEDGVCEATFTLKVGDNPELILDACRSWEVDFNFEYDPDTSPKINGGVIKLKATTERNFECDLTLEFTSLSCGLDQVYKIGSTLNISDCSDLADQYEGSYHIDPDQGLIVSFTEINTGNQRGNFSGIPLFTQISGHIGTLNENGITLSNQQGSFQSYLYGSFSISSVEVRDDAEQNLNCNQNSEVTVYDFDGDGESSFVYGYGAQDCDDRNPRGNSLHPENCRPCGVNCPNFEWIFISSGSFDMGTNLFPSSSPVHHVQIRNNFHVTKTEVNVGQFRACVNANICDSPYVSEMLGCNYTHDIGLKEDRPINCITWENARQFAKWMGGDLLTEAQWEYTASAQGQSISYPWGNSTPTCDFANFMYINESGDFISCALMRTFNPFIIEDYTEPSCCKIAGNTSQGVCDMAGNVSEWVLDEYHDSYLGAPIDDRGWCRHSDCVDFSNLEYGVMRVVRGSSFGSSQQDASLNSIRYSARAKTYTASSIGFRVADNRQIDYSAYDINPMPICRTNIINFCQNQCSDLGDCAVSICNGYVEDDRQHIIEECNTTCQDDLELTMLFNQQETCEAKVEFVSGVNPDFAVACAGELQTPCSIACSILADCAVEACIGYAPEDKTAIKASCEISCTPELASSWSVLACAEQVTAFSAISEPFKTQCEQAEIACNVCTVYGATLPSIASLIVDTVASSPSFQGDFAYLVSKGPEAVHTFKSSLANFVSDAFACTNGAYNGPSMVAAHTGLGITSERYDEFVGLIANVMTQVGVSAEYLGTCFAPALTNEEFKAPFLTPTFPTCGVNVCETYGVAVFSAIVSDIVDTAATDPNFSADFASLVVRESTMRGAVDAFKASLTRFITDAFGCTTGAYTGVPMDAAHTGQGITRAEYHDFIVRLIVGVLSVNGVPEADILGCFAPKLLDDDLVNSIVEK
jgi:formylglycine-generating enzyme required for sulfatase activity/truncated hemoglobin YjbI